MYCDSGLTFSFLSTRSSRAATIAELRETPPVKVISSSMPTRRISPAERVAIDRCTPHRMSSIFLPLPSHDSTSDSANTVQVVLIFTGCDEPSAVSPSSSSGISRAADAAPRNRPVPAAHLSFMQKSRI